VVKNIEGSLSEGFMEAVNLRISNVLIKIPEVDSSLGEKKGISKDSTKDGEMHNLEVTGSYPKDRRIRRHPLNINSAYKVQFWNPALMCYRWYIVRLMVALRGVP
jgi:hypothetical protein